MCVLAFLRAREVVGSKVDLLIWFEMFHCFRDAFESITLRESIRKGKYDRIPVLEPNLSMSQDLSGSQDWYRVLGLVKIRPIYPGPRTGTGS